MVNRTVAVTFSANVGPYTSKVEGAAKSTDRLADAAGKAERGTGQMGGAAGKAGRDVEGVGGKLSALGKSIDANREQWDGLATGFMTGGAVMAAGTGVAIAKFADFEQAMSEAAFAAGATGDDYEVLKNKAIEMGESSVFSATEAAQAQVELGKAGLSTSDIVGGALAASMDLAAAGGLEMKDAAELTSTTMKTFGLEAGDAGKIADALAGSANASAADVDELAFAMSQVGGVAAATGVSMEDTTATLGAFADQGLRGSDAGTSMKTMLQRLAAPTGKAAGLMEELGINAFDAQGNFIGMEALAGQLEGALGGMSEQQRSATLSMIFGSDAMRGANALYATGADGMAKYGEAVRQQGNAQDMAAAKMDNMKGDAEELFGALETLFITSADGSAGPLRDLVQGVTEGVRWFSQLPEPVKDTAFVLGGVAGAGGLAAGATIKAATAARDLTRDAKGVVDSLKAWREGTKKTKDSLADTQGAVDRFGGAARDGKTHVEGIGDVARASSGHVDDLGAAADRGKGKVQGVGDASGRAKAGIKDVGDTSATSTGQVDKLASSSDKAGKKTGKMGDSAGKARGRVKALGIALGAAAGAAVLMQAGSKAAAEEVDSLGVASARLEGSLDRVGEGGNILEGAFADTGIAEAATDTALFRDYLDKATASGGTFTGAMMGVGRAFDGLGEMVGADLGALDDFNERMAAAGEVIAATAEEDLPRASEQFQAITDQMGLSREEAGKLLNRMPALREELVRQANAAGEATDDQTLLAIALGETVLPAQGAADGADKVAASTEGAAEQVAALTEEVPELTDQLAATENGWTVMVEGAEDAEDAAERAQSSVDEFIDSISAMNGAFLDERGAQREWVEALAGMDEALKENGRTLDINTEKGRNNQAALDGLAGNLGALIEAQAKGGASTEQLTATMEAGREKIIRVAQQLGYTEEEARRYADTLGLTPALIESQIIARGIDTGIEGSQNLQFEMGKIPTRVETQISMAGEVLASEKLRMVEDSQARIDPFTVTGVRVDNAVEAAAVLGGVAQAQDRVDPFTTTGVRAENAVEVAGQLGNIATAQDRVSPFTSTAVSAPNAVEVAGQLGNVTDKANAIPAEKRVAVSTPGTESAREQLIRVDAAAIELSNGETVDLSTPGWGDAIKNLQAVDVEAIRLSNGEEIPIEAPGWHQTRDALSVVDDTARALSDAENVAVTETGSRGVQGWLDRVDAAARAMSNGENVDVTERGAYSTEQSIWGVDRAADNLDGRVVDVTIKQRFTQAGERIRGAVSPWFAEGGYTGPGGKYDPKGVVHAGEFVHTQEELQAPGARQFHDALWRQKGRTDYGALTRALRGYAAGGYVGGSPLGLGRRGAGSIGAGFTFGAGFDPDLLTRAARDAITSMDWDLLRAMIGDGWQDAMTAADWEAVGALAADQMTLRGHQAGAAFGAAQAATTEVAMADVAGIVIGAVDRQGQHVAGGLSTVASATEVAMADLTGTVAGAVDRQHQDVAGGLAAVVAATDQTVERTRRVVDADLSTTGSRAGQTLAGMATATDAAAAEHRATVDGALARSAQSTSAALAGIRGETAQTMGQVRAEVESTLAWARDATRGTLASLEDAAQSTVAGVRRQVQAARSELDSVRSEAARDEARRAAKPRAKAKPRTKTRPKPDTRRQAPLTYDWDRAARNAGKPQAWMRRVYGPSVSGILAGSLTRRQASEDLWGLLMDQGWTGGTASGGGRLRAPSRSAIERALRWHRDRYVTGRFADGGWTGPGARLDAKGVVHADEFVHTKAEMQRPGALAFHTELWRRKGETDYKALTRALRGYATGGPVAAPVRAYAPAPRYTAPAPTAAAAGNGHTFNITQNYPQAEPDAIGVQRVLQYAGLN